MLHEATRVICEEPPSRSRASTARSAATSTRSSRSCWRRTRPGGTRPPGPGRRSAAVSERPADRGPSAQHGISAPQARAAEQAAGGRGDRVVRAAVGGRGRDVVLGRAGDGGGEGSGRPAARRPRRPPATRRSALISRGEADKALAVVQFLESTLAAADPDKKGRDARLVDMLDGAVAEVDTSLDDKLEVAAAMRRAVAGAYRGLGLVEQADTQATKAVETLTKLNGPDHSDTLDAREVLARIRMNQLASRRGRDRPNQDLRRACSRRGPRGRSRPGRPLDSGERLHQPGQARRSDRHRATGESTAS